MRLTGDKKREYIGEKREKHKENERGKGKYGRGQPTYDNYTAKNTREGKRQYDLVHAYKRGGQWDDCKTVGGEAAEKEERINPPPGRWE